MILNSRINRRRSLQRTVEEPQVDELRLYLTEVALRLDPILERSLRTGNNVNIAPADPALIQTLEISGVNGVYQGGDVELICRWTPNLLDKPCRL